MDLWRMFEDVLIYLYSVGYPFTRKTPNGHSHYKSHVNKQERVFGHISYLSLLSMS